MSNNPLRLRHGMSFEGFSDIVEQKQWEDGGYDIDYIYHENLPHNIESLYIKKGNKNICVSVRFLEKTPGAEDYKLIKYKYSDRYPSSRQEFRNMLR